MPAALANDAPRSRQHGPAGLPARRLAWEAVAEVLRRRGALDDALDDLAGRARLDARDEGEHARKSRGVLGRFRR